MIMIMNNKPYKFRYLQIHSVKTGINECGCGSRSRPINLEDSIDKIRPNTMALHIHFFFFFGYRSDNIIRNRNVVFLFSILALFVNNLITHPV